MANDGSSNEWRFLDAAPIPKPAPEQLLLVRYAHQRFAMQYAPTIERPPTAWHCEDGEIVTAQQLHAQWACAGQRLCETAQWLLVPTPGAR